MRVVPLEKMITTAKQRNKEPALMTTGRWTITQAMQEGMGVPGEPLGQVMRSADSRSLLLATQTLAKGDWDVDKAVELMGIDYISYAIIHMPTSLVLL